MKKHEVRRLEGIMEVLCHDLKGDPYALHRLAELILGCIDLTRNGKAWKATSIALETSARLASSLEQARAASRDAQRQDGPAAWSTPISIRTTQPSFTGYVGINHDAPRPAATVEQMRAAADAAMASDDEMDEYECDSCHKATLVPMDSGTPKGWQPSDNPDGEEYICNECHKFGHKHGPDLRQKYVCGWCNSTTESSIFPPPGWKEAEDNEVICFACAEEEAKP